MVGEITDITHCLHRKLHLLLNTPRARELTSFPGCPRQFAGRIQRPLNTSPLGWQRAACRAPEFLAEPPVLQGRASAAWLQGWALRQLPPHQPDGASPHHRESSWSSAPALLIQAGSIPQETETTTTTSSPDTFSSAERGWRRPSK